MTQLENPMTSPAHQAVVSAIRAMPPIGSGGKIDVAAERAAMVAMTASTPLPQGAKFEPTNASGVPAEWISFADSDSSKVILYLHGGGYALGSIETHRALAARIAEASGTRCLLIDYRLAPETAFPGAVEDATASYLFLRDQGFAPEQIAIGGDSAGGGLTFATLVNLKDQGHALPAAGFALSPWVDLEGLGESMTTKADADPGIVKEGLVAIAKLYLGGADPKAPLAAPLYADVSGLPPILIQVGTAEVLLDDSVRIAERLRAAGGTVELRSFEDLIHVFQALAPMVPEALEAIDEIGVYLKRHL
jgi:monoterpene epsilon-lactone hydrolase